MKLIKDFGTGFINCFRAFSPLFEKGLWPYLFYPLLVWLGLWAASIYGVVMLTDYLTEIIKPYFTIDSFSDIAWLPKMSGFLGVILGWVLNLILWFLGSIFIKYFLLMILSPLFALLSEVADEKLTGKKFPFSIKQLLKDVARGIAITFRNLFMELLISFGLWLIAIFVPPLIFITFPLGLVVGWYFIGFSIMDYNCERYRFNMSASIQFIKKHKGHAIGVGCVYSIFMALPTVAGDAIGIMFGPTLAVIGATMSFLKINEAQPSQSSPLS